MGHHGKIVVNTEQGSAIIDLFRVVAKGRGEACTVFETAARSDSEGNGEAEKAVHRIEEMVRAICMDAVKGAVKGAKSKADVETRDLRQESEHSIELLNRCTTEMTNEFAHC